MWIWMLYWYDTIGDIQFLIIIPWGVVSPYMKRFTEGLLWSTVLQQFCHSRIFTEGAWMGQGCKCSPPTTVAQVWFLDLVFIVGTCPCSKEKNNFPNSNFTWKPRKRSATLNIFCIIYIIIITITQKAHSFVVGMLMLQYQPYINLQCP